MTTARLAHGDDGVARLVETHELAVDASFEPVLPEDLEERWIDYYSGEETSPIAAVPRMAFATHAVGAECALPALGRRRRLADDSTDRPAAGAQTDPATGAIIPTPEH